MIADFQYDYSNNANSRAGCEKKVFIKLPRPDGNGHIVLTLGTVNRLAFNVSQQVKPVLSIGRISANSAGHGIKTCYGVLAFHVIETSTIEYLKNQIEEVTGEKYIGAFKLHDLDEFDIIMISADENDVSGNYSKRIIRGVKIDSESGALGSDVLSMTEEYTFKARDIGELTAEEIQIYSGVLGGN